MENKMFLQIHALQDGVTKLGPGTRYCIWVQGCKRHCAGCMTPASRPLNGGFRLPVAALAQKILGTGRTELTISGGEPFLQAEALLQLLRLLRQERGFGVIVYTGYTLEELQNSPDPAQRQLLQAIDLVIDGEFVQALQDGKNWRGSSNQRAIPLTPRYAAEALEYGTRPAEVEFFCREDKISMVGIPSAGMLEIFKKYTGRNQIL